jgi:hypothetical protein
VLRLQLAPACMACMPLLRSRRCRAAALAAAAAQQQPKCVGA